MAGAMQNWEHWRSFLAVVGEGSLSGAARALSLTQPTVGRHIAALEEGLGVTLFTRSRGGLNPTGLALSLVPQARAMATAADNLLRTASGERDEARGTVRLTASDIVGTFVLPPMLAAFREAHSGIVIELSLSTRNENLLRREADIAVRMVRPVQEAIVARHVGAVRIGLFAHRRYVAAHGLPESADDLFSHPIVGIDQEEGLVADLSFGGHALSRESFAFRCDSGVAQLMAVKAGFGIGACQLGLAAAEPDLVRVLPEVVEFGYEMWLAMHEDLRATRRVRLLFDHLAEGLSVYARRQQVGPLRTVGPHECCEARLRQAAARLVPQRNPGHHGSDADGADACEVVIPPGCDQCLYCLPFDLSGGRVRLSDNGDWMSELV